MRLTPRRSRHLHQDRQGRSSWLVKLGGSGEPANNSRLATVVAKAKAANMPNDNIKRTIDKATGRRETPINYESVTYEGYGPCGLWP